jgi:ubiquinone/menaquinone biosynthesis C-methylase UbiE
MFGSSQESHNHSREVLDVIETFYEFMISVGTVADMGGGSGLDAEWWATRETDPEVDSTGKAQPLNIKSFVIDTIDKIDVTHKNITHLKTDMENTQLSPNRFDVITSHNSFQHAINPVATLRHWWELANPNGMLILQIPQTTNIRYNRHDISNLNSEYYHYTLVNLIHMLAVNGWDCKSGLFTKGIRDPWIKAIVYKGNVKPQDPRTTTWHDLAKLDLLPESAVSSINRWGHVKQADLVLPWFAGHLDAYNTH